MLALGHFVFLVLCFVGDADRSDDNNAFAVEVMPSAHGMLHKRTGLSEANLGFNMEADSKALSDTLGKAVTQAALPAQASPWMGLWVACFVAGWTVASIMLSSEEVKSEDVEYEKFEKDLDSESKDRSPSSSCWLLFEDSTSERRFARGLAAELCRKVRFFCIFLWLFAVGSFLFSVDTKSHDHLVINPSISNWRSSSAIVFNATAICLLVLAASMYVLTSRPGFARSNKLETYVAAWFALVMALMTVFLSRWHMARLYGEDAKKIFLSYHSDDRVLQLFALVIIFVCMHTPMRFSRCVPLCALAPCMYGSMAYMIGTPDVPEEDYGTILDQWENGVVLVICCIMCCAGVHFIERQNRSAFLRTMRSYEMLQELVAEEDHDDGSTAMGKARQSLKVAAAGLEQMTADADLPKALSSRMDAIKKHLDVAVKSLKNVDNLFEVDADNVLGEEFADDSVFKDYINANMGGRAVQFAPSQFPGKLMMTNERSMNPLSEPAESVALGSKSFGAERSTEHSSVPRVKASILAKGWGEDWGFDAPELARKTNATACLFAGECALIESGFGDVLSTHRECLRSWVRAIHSRYLPNSYHNEAHACQVTHMAKWLAQQTGWITTASDVQMCGLMIASLGHDVGHIGRTNLFCANAWHSFAMIWNDHAVLENMHAATCFSIMKGESHIMENLEPGPMSHMRNCIVRFILATDIKEHHASLVKLKARMEEDNFMVKPMEDADDEAWKKFEEDVIVGGETLIKSSDIGQGLMPWDQHKEWSYRVVLEFFLQGDEEKRLGLTVSPLCERKGYNIVGGQGFFIDVLCKSLFTVLVRFAEPASEGKRALEECLELGAKNKERWKTEVENFYPETLSMDVIVQRFGATEPTSIYPYTFPQDQVLTKTVSTEENLNDIAKFQNSIF